MKKTYCKPQISFEDFELCANIAAGCVHKANQWRGVCAYRILGGYMVFVDGVNDCTYRQQEGAYGVCYHGPTETNAIFGS